MGGHAWGCIIPNGENYVEWKSGKGAGTSCDGSKCKNKFNSLDSSFARVYCGLEEEAQEERAAETPAPTKAPTKAPTSAPTITSSSSPTESPTTASPTDSPTSAPTTS